MAGGGVSGVIEGAAPPAKPQQADLLPLPAPAPPRSRGQRGPNRSTKETRAWILGRYDNPLEGMAALSLPADVLQIAQKARAMASAFRCTVKEAVELMLKASQAANPYLNSPMPQDLNINSNTTALFIGMGAAPGAGPSGNGLGQLRAEMLARARQATPEGAKLLEDVAYSLSDENAEKTEA